MAALIKGTFAALPYVRLHGTEDISIGDFVLWPNTAAAWIRRTGVDNTPFLTMYRGADGSPVEERCSLLSRPDLSEASWEDFRDSIYCLSTAAWLSGHPASDDWVFERWSLPLPTPTDEAFYRHSKFSGNLTDSEVDRVYPTPYTHTVDVAQDWSGALTWLTAELRKPREKSILAAMSHFHRARFNTPYFTSPGDDVEAL